MQTSLAATRGHIPNLNGLRAVSIILVVCSHVLTFPLPGGYGVLLFFVISGFLITRLMFAELQESASSSEKHFASAGLLRFYARRFFRLYPAVVVYCGVIVCCEFYHSGKISWVEPVSALAYFSNYLVPLREHLGIPYQMPFKIFWSLSVEEHFYFVFPLIVLFIGNHPRKLFAIFAALCIVSLVLRIRLSCLFPTLAQSHFMNMRTEFRMDSIGFGVCFACLCQIEAFTNFVKERMTSYAALLACGIIVLLIHLCPPSYKVVWREPALGLFFVVLIATLLFSERLRILSSFLCLPLFEWIGKISYSLYLWHLPCFCLSCWFLGSGLHSGIIALAVSILVAAFSYYLVEIPAINFGRRYLGSTKSSIEQKA